MSGGRLFGRDSELRLVHDLVDDPDVQLVTLTGRGGVGKTRLASEVARRCADDFEVHLVALEHVHDPMAIVPAIAHALGLPDWSLAELLDAVVERVGSCASLLVLDNLEHLLSGAAVLAQLLDRAPSLTILVTSQAPTRLAEERVVRLAPLPAPASGSRDEPAVGLYCERARAADHRFALRADNAEVVAELCRRLEGLPLAIELAAARAASVPAAAMLEMLRERPLGAGEGGGRRGGSGRHRDLASTIEWTYELLEPAEQQLLDSLAMVGAPFDLGLLFALAPADVAAAGRLASLVDLHLVEPADQPVGWYSVPASIREFVIARTATAGTLGPARRAFVRAAAERAAAIAREHEVDDGVAASAWFRTGRSMLETALDVAIEDDLLADAAGLVWALGPVWERVGLPATRAEALALLADRVEAAPDVPPARRADVLRWSAWFDVTSRGRLETVGPKLAAAEAAARTSGEDEAILRVRWIELGLSPLQGRLEHVGELLADTLAVAVACNADRWVARLQMLAAMRAQQMGDGRTAAELGVESLVTARRTDDHRTIVMAAMLLARLDDAVELGDVGATLTEALDHARAIGIPQTEAVILAMLAADSLTRSETAVAAQWCADGLQLAAAAPDGVASVFVLMAAALVASAHDHAELAAEIDGSIGTTVDLLEQSVPAGDLAAYRRAVSRATEDPGYAGWNLAGRTRSRREILRIAQQEMASWLEVEPSSGGSLLTPTQLRVVALLADGLTNKEIAARLAMAPKTVMHHTTAIYRALGVRRRAEAAAWAVRQGVVGVAE